LVKNNNKHITPLQGMVRLKSAIMQRADYAKSGLRTAETRD
jgi:hypothetical protein